MKDKLRKQVSESMKLYHSKLRHSKSFDELGRSGRKIIILEEQDHKCICGQGELWNGEPLVLQLDHIDGDTSNWARDNLRMLCPNCHTQTPTYCFKDGKRKRKVI